MSDRSSLALLAVVATLAAGLIAAGPASASSCTRASAAVTHLTLSKARATTLCLLNRIRRQHGLAPFAPSMKLRRAADSHSRDMVRHRFFAHGNYLTRILRTGYTAGALSWAVGENLAWGSGGFSSPARIVRRWMNSPPHRQNILTGRFRHIGIGIAKGTPTGARGGTYTTDFGARR